MAGKPRPSPTRAAPEEVERLTADDLHPQRQEAEHGHGPKSRAAFKENLKGSRR